MISILMPIYNGIEFIDESVTSILTQSFTQWELIIGINGHPENSEVYQRAKYYEKDQRVHVYDLFTLRGKSESLNVMLSYCRYDWISILDVDDKWKSTKLEKQLPFINDYDVIGTQCQYFGENQTIPFIPVGDLKDFDFLQVNPVINSSCLLKKEGIDWNSQWNGVEDYDLWLRLWKKGGRFYNVPSIEVFHRIHRQSAYNANGNNNMVPLLLQKYI